MVPPVAGTPLTITTPVTVASVSEVSTLGLPSPQPGVVVQESKVIARRSTVRRRKSIMGSIRKNETLRDDLRPDSTEELRRKLVE
jgi:hypothetical protein